jgi:hypothetical protein
MASFVAIASTFKVKRFLYLSLGACCFLWALLFLTIWHFIVSS